MLEIIIEGNKYDFNRLQEQIMLRVNEGIIYHLAQGVWDENIAHPETRVNVFIRAILSGAEGKKLDEKEKAWLAALRLLAEAIRSIDNKKYDSLGKEARVRYAHRTGLRFADLLRPLLEGYVSRSSPLCPACPEAKPGVTWETWKAALDPRRFFDIANMLPFVVGSDGTISTGHSISPDSGPRIKYPDEFPGALDCGDDKELFVKRANKFVPATLKIDFKGTIYRCHVDNAGHFIKRIETVSPCEPWDMGDFLRDKYLTARYGRGRFYREWVDSLSWGLENCDGPLKDAFVLLRNGGTLPEIRARIRALHTKETGLREGKTVLVVDDERDTVHLIGVLLNRYSPEIKVLTGLNGREGLDVLLKEKVDLLVLNLMMPEMDGYQVLKEMQKDKGLRKIPVLVSTGTPFRMSGFVNTSDPFSGMYVEWQELPFDPKKIVKRIRRMLMEGEKKD